MASKKKSRRKRNRRRGQDERGLETEARALDLRKRGYTFAEIGKQLGITMQGAHLAVHRALDKIASLGAEEARDLRRIELERLDRLQKALAPKANKGNAESARALLRVMDRRARLLGLDAPVKSDLNFNATGLAEFIASSFDDDETNPPAGAGEGTAGPVES